MGNKLSWVMFFQSILSLSVLILLSYSGILVIKFIFEKINFLNPNVGAAIIATLAAVFSVLYQQNKVQKRQTNEAHRLKKVALYKSFMDIMLEALMNTKKSEEEQKKLFKKMEKSFMEFKTDLIIWGSPKVIDKFNKYIASVNKPKKILLCVDALLRAIRKDLGVNNGLLAQGDLIKLYLKDTKELDKIIKNAS